MIRSLPLSLILALAACASCSKKSTDKPVDKGGDGAGKGAPGADGPTKFPDNYKVENIDGDGFTVTVATPPAAVGAEAKAVVELRPKAPFHLNKEFPTQLTLTAPAGVDVPKTSFEHNEDKNEAASWTDHLGSFQIAFTAKEKADVVKKITAVFNFAVCTTNSCDPKQADLAIAVLTP
jgi:hypothetical protein